ncbi:flavocytochrome c [Desulfopila sp. IMCC35008]|uniref:flavocytochrome c n=1 Tax=Desulfopila sp. IMCC35008 TaxID=2653858 RepID=UPI0013D29066|nr:flavocytochrome c [Desulfopila sp. IMCC35008]
MTHVEWDDHADVIVIGSGLAGLSAAIEARKHGSTVIVLEKMNVSGGNSRISDGGLAAPGTPQQKEAGIQDSPDLFYNDMLKAGLYLNHPELVKIVADRAAGIIDWTRKLGVRYQERLDRSGGHSVARTLTTKSHSGSEIIKALVRKLKQLKGELRCGSLLTQFISDSSGVIGVRIRSGYRFGVQDSGIVQHVRADRAVVLATGGFSGDIGFRRLQNPLLDDSIGSTNHRGATAEGLRAVLAIKGAPVHLSWIQTGPWSCADEPGYGKGSRFASYSVFPHGIIVDPASGCRVLNEWGDRRERSEAIITCGHPCIGIVDAAGAQADSESLVHCVKKGKVKKFDTIAGLAKAYNMPVNRLENEIGKYNRMIEDKVTDKFGKSLGDGAKKLVDLPFYSIRLWPKVHHTPGGVAIDEHARVLDLYGTPIGRLFAAGEVSGGVNGASRLGSCALPECLIFGRIAGKEAALLPTYLS